MIRSLWILLVVACGADRVSIDEVVDSPPVTPDAEPPLEPTYVRDVAPILTARCGSCHLEGGVAPFPLATFEQASALSEAIATATSSRVMPPWGADASGACSTFVDPRWLTPREIAVLDAWHAQGARLGDPADAVIVQPPPPLPFTPAVTLASAEAYSVRPGPDEYRCFVVDPGLTEDRYITALALELDRADVVHHMQLFAAVSALGETTIDERLARDAAPGYACDTEGVGRGLQYVGVWAGGDLTRRWPDDTGIKIEAGHRLVVQFHYHNHGSEPVFDRSAVQLELATSVAHAGRITSAQPINFTLPPGQPATSVSSTLPVSAAERIRGARIHMHGRGASARLERIRDGVSTCVLDIPRWDEGWQLFYRFADPIDVLPGDALSVRCTYDTSASVDPVVWGEGTDDEMCIGYAFSTP